MELFLSINYKSTADIEEFELLIEETAASLDETPKSMTNLGVSEIDRFDEE